MYAYLRQSNIGALSAILRTLQILGLKGGAPVKLHVNDLCS